MRSCASRRKRKGEDLVTWIFLALIPKGSSPTPVINSVPMMNMLLFVLVRSRGGTCQGFYLSSSPAPRSGTGWPWLTSQEAQACCSTGTGNLLSIKYVMLMKSFQFPVLLTLIHTARHHSAFRWTLCECRALPAPRPHSQWKGTYLEDD